MEHHQTVARPHNDTLCRLSGNCLVCIYQFLTSNFNFKQEINLRDWIVRKQNAANAKQRPVKKLKSGSNQMKSLNALQY